MSPDKRNRKCTFHTFHRVNFVIPADCSSPHVHMYLLVLPSSSLIAKGNIAVHLRIGNLVHQTLILP